MHETLPVPVPTTVTGLDADAVVTMRIETSEIGGAAAEIHAYGTTVRLE